MTTPALRTEDLRRTYRRKSPRKNDPAGSDTDFVALDGVSLEVPPGELFGLLGPNGAGKTTLIKILTTLLAPTSGRAWVDGLDVVADARQLRPRINMVSGGESCGYGVLNVRENLWLFTQVYGVPSSLAMKRIDEMLAVVGLEDKAKTKVSHLSTGQRQKMNFCRGFLTDPRVLFLDEPTLGLDVNAARAIRGFVRRWLADGPGRTLLLTTHYMAEADELCDRVAVIDRGKVLACDTPAALKRRVQGNPVFTLSLAGPVPDLSDTPGVRQATRTDTADGATLRLSLDEESAIGPAVAALSVAGARVRTLAKEEATLEDVFIALVGRGLGDTEVSA